MIVEDKRIQCRVRVQIIYNYVPALFFGLLRKIRS